MTHEWSDFEGEVLDMARFIRGVQSVPYANSTPSDVCRDLTRIDKAISTVLQVLVPLDLCHKDGQDLATEPYNWPVVQSLQTFRYHALPPEPANSDPTFPTALIRQLTELRDAARLAAKLERPKRGNSSRIAERTYRIHMVGKNFVLDYRAKFGEMPPMSSTGREVALLQRALEAAGLEQVDASDVLRRSIEQCKRDWT